MSKPYGVCTLLIFFNVLMFSAHSQEGVGTVKVMKGELSRAKGDEPQKMAKGDDVLQGDKLLTGVKSFSRVELKDLTLISLGPSTEFVFKEAGMAPGKRRLIVSLIKGKIRSLVKKKAVKGEIIEFDSASIALGVRGTEFLINSYGPANKPVADVYLLSGELDVDPSKAKAGMKKFKLQSGKSFNTKELIEKGIKKAIKEIAPKLLKSLKENSGQLLSDAKAIGSGALNSAGKLGAKIAGVGAGAGAIAAVASGAASGAVSGGKSGAVSGNVQASAKPLVKKPVAVKKPSSKIKGINPPYKYNLAKEEWDIRDYVINRKRYQRDGDCFYYFYKKVPGSGEEERFRRSRDCDEYENDL